MPYKEKETEKLYYSISEVAEMFEVNTSLIRFWEKEFPILKPKKNKKGNRLFTKDDIEHLRTIYKLVREKGFTLQGARDKLKEKEPIAHDGNQQQEVLKKLLAIKETLLDLNNRILEEPQPKPVSLAQKLAQTKPVDKPLAREKEKEKTMIKDLDPNPNQISLF